MGKEPIYEGFNFIYQEFSELTAFHLGSTFCLDTKLLVSWPQLPRQAKCHY